MGLIKVDYVTKGSNFWTEHYSAVQIVREGGWWLNSDSDSKWNINGSGYVGGFMMPSECKDAIKELKKEYGEPSEDLEWGYMKD